MSTLYGGKSANISFNAVLTVTGASNTNPITITVSGALPASFYTSGGLGGTPAAPLVDISGVGGNNAANGVFVATPTGASTFTIPVAGSGAYTSGGSVQPLDMLTTPTVPSDGDADNEASIDSWAKATGDRTQWLAARTGYVKLVGRVALTWPFGPSSAWANLATTFGAGSWGQWGCAGGLSALAAETGSLSINSISGVGLFALYSFAGISSVDILRVSLETTCAFAASASSGDYVGLYSAIVAPGSAAPTFSGMTRILGSAKGGDTPARIDGVRCSGWLPHVGTGTLYVAPAYYRGTGGAFVASLQDDTVLEVEAWRLTGMPQ
jgi:hypothetical protein